MGFFLQNPDSPARMPLWDRLACHPHDICYGGMKNCIAVGNPGIGKLGSVKFVQFEQ